MVNFFISVKCMWYIIILNKLGMFLRFCTFLFVRSPMVVPGSCSIGWFVTLVYLTPLYLKPEYYWITRSITWLLMPWFLLWPSHPQLYYYYMRSMAPCPSLRMISTASTIQELRNLRKYKYIFMFPKINSVWQLLNLDILLHQLSCLRTKLR